MQTLTYVYDDVEYPTRPTSAIQSPAFTLEDQVLLRGLELYEQTLCRCGEQRSVAWHTEMDGYYEDTEAKCFACSAREGRDVVYHLVHSTRSATQPMPAFALGVTTTGS